MSGGLTDLAEPLVRLGTAALVGALIGLNRDLYGKPTGIRLHALVAVGSALFVMLASPFGFGSFDQAAASRIIQGIVGGIGFLGAGVILRSPGGDRIQHITTAATIWVTAALGSACGLGSWALGLVAALFVLLILTFGLKLDRRFHQRSEPDDLGP
ncbi:MgtC/SapB transporter [Methylobacterium nodulans ORS 2060]|uniref:Protein MgtC n=1 Tax=Methylobacterium nodulans (strain LMG 21967 / CNCM I-2342 / ORS 2060) TaxID=460265 RepID=B8IFA9_METNO|nr:MgtC/SapB family protein [Methylobacterium nodulans]ACL55820.1 MgtC/SapB transporter [Methylobacterium nodulans ORS 2060]